MLWHSGDSRDLSIGRNSTTGNGMNDLPNGFFGVFDAIWHFFSLFACCRVESQVFAPMISTPNRRVLILACKAHFYCAPREEKISEVYVKSQPAGSNSAVGFTYGR